jgi:hypothetical protein
MQDTWRFNQAVDRYQANEPTPGILKKNEHFRPLRFLSTYSAGLWLLDESKLLEQVTDCPYPVVDAAGNQLAFYDSYMSMSTVDTDALRESDVYAETRDAILSAAEQAQAMDATFVLMFIPTKFHVHYPMLLEAGAIPRLAQEFDAFRIGNKGFVPDASRSDPDQVADLVAQNIDNQRTLLGELAQEQGFLFLDLTPALQDAAAQGFAAYGDGDTHWDQEGNEFVRGVMQEFLAEQGLLE